jgi:hypothetical protein
MDSNSYEPMPVPYLDNPPEVIPIDIGRQFFIDDYLIESTTLKRKFHKPRKFEGNPILTPETSLEMGDENLPVACPKDGGVWWDPEDKIFKMWYEAAWLGSMAYAISTDGIKWERPEIRGNTNQLFPHPCPDSTTVFLDHDARNPEERFKMFLREPGRAGHTHGYSMVSPDGINWGETHPTGFCGDRTTMFYNPFRKKWIYSIRSWGEPIPSGIGRARYYYECSDFIRDAKWNNTDPVFWTGADRLDPPDPEIGDKAQLYNLSAVAYESIMLGFHQIHLGPSNEICRQMGMPKITELMISYSRDGFHWHRPDRDAFIPATRKEGDWDRGYVQSVGGICTIIEDQLRFYYIGFKGDKNNHKSGIYAHGSTGMALLRRDGFASMTANEAEGVLTTRPVTFHGRFMFVNIDCPGGLLKVEILDDQHTVLPDFSIGNCIPISANSTIHQVVWRGSQDLSALSGMKVRFRFHLRNGSLYSFWVSRNDQGSSNGYVAAGGPGFKDFKDEL